MVLVRIRKHQAPISFAGKMLRFIKVTCVIVFVFLSFGMAFKRRLNFEDAGESVTAHASGFLAGLLAGFTVLRDYREEKWERQLKKVS